MRVLVACEYSGRVRDAFRALGHDAWSCDLLPSEVPSFFHFERSIQEVLHLRPEWDLMIAHPPCTHLAVSGARHFARKVADGSQLAALGFVRFLLEETGIPRIALENPVSIISSRIRKPDQIIQPWQFGHGETKATCLWLKGLPLLKPTNIVEPTAWRCCGKRLDVDLLGVRGCPNCEGSKVAVAMWGNQTGSGQNKLAPSPDRWKERSRTYQGIADAMAAQWGGPCVAQSQEAA